MKARPLWLIHNVYLLLTNKEFEVLHLRHLLRPPLVQIVNFVTAIIPDIRYIIESVVEWFQK